MVGMTVETRLRTADDLWRMPDDGFRYELVQGEIRRMTPAGARHGAVAINAGARLGQYVRENGLGVVFGAETGFKISANPDTVRAPDVAFVRRDRIGKAGIPDGYWIGAPDLAVEVVSPGDSYTEVQEKVLDWLAAGTRMVIVLDPGKRVVSVHRATAATLLGENDVLSGEDVVPGWSVAVKDDLFD
jgi:Uma2 family endonuclease